MRPQPQPQTITPSFNLILPSLQNNNGIPRSTQAEIEKLLKQPNYPCLAALKSFHRNDYQVGFYEGFGAGMSWRELRNDLRFFLQEHRKSESPYLTFWAIFQDERTDYDEENFESALWRELSFLTSAEKRSIDWANGFSSDPEKSDFSFCLDGEALFVVGLHPNSPRKSRRFRWPALVFNVFAQFAKLEQLGQYDSLVEQNRKRDLLFQGNVNPMVEKYGDHWEAIQFSGRENKKEWKCPFRFISDAFKES